MKLRKTIVVPTYWDRPEAEGIQRGDLIFDHATAVDGSETLSKMLQSLAVLNSDDYQLVIIVVPTCAEIADAAKARVIEITNSLDLPVQANIFTQQALDKINTTLAADAEKYEQLLSLRGYAQARNACLLASYLSGADVAVMIDDDEIFQLPDFLDKIDSGFADKFEGEKVDCLVGYYVDAQGDYMIPPEASYWEAQWPKVEKMNEAFRQIIGQEPRYKNTPFGFGGNLSISRKLFSTLPFDTRLTRGEDIDYLIMARMHGISAVLDNQLSILHQAPAKSHPAWMQLRQDFLRFVYEKAKLDAAMQGDYDGIIPVKPEELDPYPGYFLTDDLAQKIEETCSRQSKYYLGIADIRAAQQAMASQELARRYGKVSQDPLAAFVALRRDWQELLEKTRNLKLEDLVENSI
jgi:hypothetical protein